MIDRRKPLDIERHSPIQCEEHHGLVRDFGGSPDKMARPTITVLCGSTRFGAHFAAENLRRTLLGEIVLSIGCDMKSDNELWSDPVEAERIKAQLDKLHMRKIDLADQVMVLNVATDEHPEGYIGSSTGAEIEYANSIGKMVFYLTHAPGWPTVPGRNVYTDYVFTPAGAPKPLLEEPTIIIVPDENPNHDLTGYTFWGTTTKGGDRFIPWCSCGWKIPWVPSIEAAQLAIEKHVASYTDEKDN